MANDKLLARRQLLKSTGLAAGASLFAACEREDPYHLDKPAVPGAVSWRKGEEKWVATACAQCPAGCGIRVRVVEGRAVKVEGNTACPVNQGGVGPRGLAGPQVLYDPDRIRQPMRRVHQRGSRSFEPRHWEAVSWEEALGTVGEHLRDLRARERANRLVILCGRERGMMTELWRRFAEAYGTPNCVDGIGPANNPVALASYLMQGVRDVPAYDWGRARYVVSLGAEVLQSSCQMVYFARAQAHIKRGVAGVRAKIVHVGPIRSRTAMNADEWISVRTGTYGAFALGLAHVLVRDGLYDEEFVRDHGFGFEDWTDEDGIEQRGFRSVLEEYRPDRVAEICGVRGGVVERIAEEMVAARPCFALAGSEEYLSSNGVGAAMAVHALNALLGSIDREGGLLTQRDAPVAEWPDVEPDELAEKTLVKPPLGAASGLRPWLRTLPIDLLPRAVLEETRDPVEALFLYHSNPLYARARPDHWREALGRISTIVSFSPFWDETTVEMADWVLPDHTYLERWEDAAPVPSVGYPVFGIRQPAVEPLHDTRHSGDVVLGLAEVVGDATREALPWKDFRDAFKKRLVGIHNAKVGSIVESKGSTFLERIYDEGYWFDPSYPHESWDDVLRTPSGRFEFFASTLWRGLRALAEDRGQSVEEVLDAWGLAETANRVCMPRHEALEWTGDPERFPLLLVPYRPPTYAEGSGANLPWLQELHASTGRPSWVTEAAIHPQTASAHGLHDGDRARVQSEIGEAEVIVQVTPGVRPGLVRIPQGGGHTAMGRFAEGWGANVMQVVSLDPLDLLFGVSPLYGTRVALLRFEA